MNLAGELVLSRNQLRAAVAQDNRALLAAVDQRVNQVTSELQDVIMQTRLQPDRQRLRQVPPGGARPVPRPWVRKSNSTSGARTWPWTRP